MRIKNFYKSVFVFALAFILTPICSSAQIEDIHVGSDTRQMLVYAPSTGIEPNRPLLISMHGMNQDIGFQRNQTQWDEVAEENDFVVVYPAGINNSWALSGTRDTDFILAIIDEIYNRYEIDRDRVYLSGFSMGGMMTYYAATQIADKIAAFAPVGGYLRGEPNTSTSRPIPIIHTHGTGDDVVPYESDSLTSPEYYFIGIESYMAGWANRNGCPETAQVTHPYPEDKPNSNATKYYWGPGTDMVEVVLLSLDGAGHWHSLDPNGVHTSREIWNFCRKFSLGFGISKFERAYITDNNQKQILVNFTLSIMESANYEGFKVKVDKQEAEIDDIVFADSTQLAINLTDDILKESEITLSYNDGNVVSIYEKELVNFTDTLVENLLYGSPPIIRESITTKNGDTLVVKFNKNMQLPSDISSLVLKAEYDGDNIIPIDKCSFFNEDSTMIAFSLGEQVFADYNLSLSYTGDNIVSFDNGLLRNFADQKVVNKSTGLPVYIDSGVLEENAIFIRLEFSKSMAFTSDQQDQIIIEVNDEIVSVSEFIVLDNSISFRLSDNVYHGDDIKVSYTPGNITAADKGELEAFSDLIVENPLSEPSTWFAIPGKIEAEDFTLQYGTDTETTGDEGGGLNVGWIDDGDWLVYAIDNTTDSTDFEITFRLAAESAGGRFELIVDDVNVGQERVPNTGGWQNWQSTTVEEVRIEPGRQYIKILAVRGGFNINYFDIQYPSPDTTTTGFGDPDTNNVIIYPNPASDKITIKSPDFRFNKIELFDAWGNTVVSRSLQYKYDFELPIDLSNGVYILKISNGKTSKISKVLIENKMH